MATIQMDKSLLRCDKCSRTVECSVDNAFHYSTTGWPKCCGEVMLYFVQAEWPTMETVPLSKLPVPPRPSTRC